MNFILFFLLFLSFSISSCSHAALLSPVDKKSSVSKVIPIKIQPVTVTIALDNIKFSDLVRLTVGDILKTSYVLDKEVTSSPDVVSVNWINISNDRILGLVSELAISRGFAISNKFGVLYFDLAQSKPSLTDVIIYRPLFRSASFLLDNVTSVTSAKSALKRGVANPVSSPSSPAAGAVGASGASSSLGSSSAATAPPSSSTSVLSNLDKALNDTLVLEVPLAEVAKVKKLLLDLDVPVGEVFIHAVVYEVTTTKGSGGAFAFLSTVLKQGVGSSVGSVLTTGNSLSLGLGNFAVAISSLDADSRFHSLSRPSVRVRSGFQAKFLVGDSEYNGRAHSVGQLSKFWRYIDGYA